MRRQLFVMLMMAWARVPDAGAEVVSNKAELRASLEVSRESSNRQSKIVSNQHLHVAEANWHFRALTDELSLESRIFFNDSNLAISNLSVGWESAKLATRLGRLPVAAGGFAAKRVGADDWMRPRYLELFPFATWEEGVDLEWRSLGDFRIFVFNDVFRDSDNPYRWNEEKHPTASVSAFFSSQQIDALIQSGFYDNSKSHWIDLSLRSHWNGFSSEVSTHYHNASHRFPDAGFVRDMGSVVLGVAMRMKYRRDRRSFYLEWSQFNVVQANEEHLSFDRKFNQFRRAENGELGARTWDDHGQTLLIGAAQTLAVGLEGFASLSSEQGTWQPPTGGSLETIRFVTANLGVILRTNH